MPLPLSCSSFAIFGCWCQGDQRSQWAEEEDCKSGDFCIQMKKRKKKINTVSTTSGIYTVFAKLPGSLQRADFLKQRDLSGWANDEHQPTQPYGTSKWHPPVWRFMVGSGGGWLGRKLVGRRRSGCLVAGVLRLGTAELRLSTAGFCVSGSPMFSCRWWCGIFFLFWKITSKIGSNASSLIVI